MALQRRVDRTVGIEEEAAEGQPRGARPGVVEGAQDFQVLDLRTRRAGAGLSVLGAMLSLEGGEVRRVSVARVLEGVREDEFEEVEDVGDGAEGRAVNSCIRAPVAASAS